MEYVDGDRVWTHAFTAWRLDDAGFAALLAGAGLRLDRYLTEDRSWLRRRPGLTGSGTGGGAQGRARISRSCGGTSGGWPRGRASRAPCRCGPLPRWWRACCACAREPRGTCASSRQGRAWRQPPPRPPPGGTRAAGDASAPDCSTAMRTSCGADVPSQRRTRGPVSPNRFPAAPGNRR